MAPPGKDVRLAHINGRRDLIGRLSALGFTPGTVLHIVQDSGGPLVIAIRNSRVALGRGMAHKIYVESIEDKVD